MPLDIGRAISRNRHYAPTLGWHRRVAEICTRILRISECSPDSRELAAAVAAWQERQVRLSEDGIIGPNSWRRMNELLRRSTGARRPAAASIERKGIIFAPRHNSAGKHDATGAFHIGAREFRGLHHLPEPVYFDNRASAQARREMIFKSIRTAPGPLEVVAYFGHGLTHSLSSAGIRTRHLTEFANAISSNATATCKVVLYACSSGAFGGFASALAGHLCGWQSSKSSQRVVFGHTNSGHSFYNPNVTLFPVSDYLIAPRSSLFSAWRHALRATNLWARFPLMTEEELQQEIEAV